MWTRLGFHENPFSTKPLKSIEEDVHLLIGRQNSAIDFITSIESEDEGIFLLSGVPGVGKTSFLNVQQFLIESNKVNLGKRLLAARQLTPIQPDDQPKDIALRCVQSLTKSIEIYCGLYNKKIPSKVTKIRKWLSQSNTGISLGLTVMGFGGNIGRTIELPSVEDTTFETLVDIISTLSLSCNQDLDFQGCFIILDNLENLSEEKLSKLLITFRDTLFSCDFIWWVLIGQSGLASLIQSIDPRVFQRVTSSLEIEAVSPIELKRAVDARIEKFHLESEKGVSPISENIYTKLYNSSNGEIRFVFKYCQRICLNFIQDIRKKLQIEFGSLDISEKVFNDALGKFLIQDQITDSKAEEILSEIIYHEFNGFNLTPKEKEILSTIGEIGIVGASDFEKFNIKTVKDFEHSYLSKLHSQYLLLRKQEGQSVKYELTGMSLLAKEYNLLNN